MVANYLHFSEVDEQTTIQVIDYFLINYVGWYRHFTVTDTGTNRDYVWISDGEPDRWQNTNPRIIRISSNGASNELRFYTYNTFVNAGSFTGEVFDAVESVIPIATVNNAWIVADKERVYIGIGIGEAANFSPAYLGRLDSLFSFAEDPYPNAVKGTSTNTDDWNETVTNPNWFALSPSGTERRYKLTSSDTMAAIGRNPRNGEQLALPQLLYTDAQAGEFEIRGYPRGAYQMSSAFFQGHLSFVTLASGVHQVFKGHQAGSNADNSSWAFGPLRDARLGDPFEIPDPYPTVDYKYRGYKLDGDTFALWRWSNYNAGTVQDDTGMHKITVANTTGLVRSPLTYAADLNGSTQYFTGTAPIVEDVLIGDWTTEIAFYPDTTPGTTNSGTLIECGSTGLTSADNTLLGIAVVSGTTAGNNICVYWDSSPGVRQQTVISGSYVDNTRWNYLAVVKDTHLGSPRIRLWHSAFGDHEMVFCGEKIMAAAATGGSSSNWFIGRKPEAAGFFDGRIDEIRISRTARTYGELTSSLKRVKL